MVGIQHPVLEVSATCQGVHAMHHCILPLSLPFLSVFGLGPQLGDPCSILDSRNFMASLVLSRGSWWGIPEGPFPAPTCACPSLTWQYVIKTVEVESSKTKQALSESQARNQHLQEQVAMQRQVLKEMEQQLQSSHQLTSQLRAQVCRSRGGREWLSENTCTQQRRAFSTGRRSALGGPTDPGSSLSSLCWPCDQGPFCPSLSFLILK